MSQRTTYPSVRTLRPLLTLGGILTLCACALDSAPNSAFTVLPGQGKDLAAFQQDNAVCRQHAVAHTGYDGPRQPSAANSAAPEAAPAASAAPGSAAPGSVTAPPEDVDVDDTAYLQCMAARGDTIRPEPLAVASPAPTYAYPYPFFGAGLAFGGWHYGGWHHGGGYYHGGTPRGWGGGHGGGGHSGGGRR